MIILIVDDEPTIARVTALAIETLGSRALIARTTTEATRLLGAEKVDAIFLDVNLGGESGLEFLSEIAAQPSPPPVVVYAALNREEFAEEALRRGALDCLAKPFTLDELRQQLIRLEHHLHGRENRPRSP